MEKGKVRYQAQLKIRTKNEKNENYAPNFMQYMYITVL